MNDVIDLDKHIYLIQLYRSAGYKNKPLLAKHSWSTVEALWPAVVDANRSEKPSVVKLLDAVLQAVGKFVDTIDIEQGGDSIMGSALANNFTT